MPIVGRPVEPSDLKDTGVIRYSPIPADRPWYEVASAAFRQEHAVASAINEARADPQRPYAFDYDPFEDLPEKYRPFANEFIGMQDADHRADKMRQIDQELQDHKVLTESGAEGMTWAMAASLTDPFGLALAAIPLAAPAGVLKTAAKTAAAAAGGVAATEAGLQGTQAARPWQTSLFNVGAAALLGGALGGLVGGLARKSVSAADLIDGSARDVSDILKTDGIITTNPADDAARHMGAAQTNYEKATLGEGTSAKEFSEKSFVARWWDSWGLPLNRMLASPSADVRRAISTLVKHNYFVEKNRRVVKELDPTTGKYIERETFEAVDPMNVETLKGRLQNGARVRIADTLSAQYAKYRTRMGQGRVSDFTPSGWRARREFMDEVGKAMRRGDAHDIPEVAEATSAMRGVLNEFKTKMQDVGLLAPDAQVGFAQTYFPRFYDFQRIKARMPEFRDMLIAEIRRGAQEQGTIMDEGEVLGTAEDILSKLLGSEVGRLPPDLRPTAGPLKGRVLAIQDEVLEPWLKTNAQEVLDDYVRAVAGDIEVARWAGGTRSTRTREGAKTAATREFEGAPADEVAAIEKQLAAETDAGKRAVLEQRRREAIGKNKALEEDITKLRAAVEAKRPSVLKEFMDAIADDVAKIRADLAVRIAKIPTKKGQANRVKAELATEKAERRIERMQTGARVKANKEMDRLFREFKEQASDLRSSLAKERAAVVGQATLSTETQSVGGLVTEKLNNMKVQYLADIEKQVAAFEAKPGKTTKEVEAFRLELNKRMDGDFRDMQYVIDSHLGIHNLPRHDAKWWSNIGKSMRSLTFMNTLGYMTISALTDPARIVMEHGLLRTFKAAGMVIGNSANPKFALKVKELQRIGVATDAIIQSRLNHIAMLDDYGDGPLARAWRGAQDAFGRASLMNFWNTNIKLVAAMAAQDEFIEMATRLANGKASAGVREELAKRGFTEAHARKVVELYGVHGEKMGSLKVPNTADWRATGDREAMQAADVFEAILLRDVDTTIVTPGVGDIPIFMSSEFGKTLLQFKSFGMASHNAVMRTLSQRLSRTGRNAAAGQLSEQDMKAIAGIMSGLVLGMMVEWSRMNMKGKGDKVDAYQTQDWIRAGLDRSGMATMPFEMFNISDRLTHGSMSKMVGLTEGSRYYYSNLLGTIGGPSIGVAQNLFDTVNTLGEGNGLTQGEVHAMRRLAPYQNIFYYDWLLTAGEGSLGLPKKDQSRTGEPAVSY